MKTMNIIEHLHDELLANVKQASEIYIAVALCKSSSLDILKKAKSSSSIKIVTGTYLPTPPDVLESLKKLYQENARVYVREKGVFHPKVYLFKIKESFVGYISSANLTQGGLSENVELSYKINNPSDCKKILEWFDCIFADASPITNTFIKEYRTYFEKWNKKEELQQRDFSNIYKKEVEFFMNKKKFVQDLKKWRNSPEYNVACKERKKALIDLKKALDYENDFKNIDIDAFLNIDHLGYIIPIHKGDLQNAVQNSSLMRLCKMLCDDTLTTSQRYEYANTKYKVPGCGKNIITKILAVHNPKEYFVWNNAIDKTLKKYKFRCARNKKWDKYAEFCTFFKSIYEEVGIKDFTVLDYGLIMG